MEIVIPPEDNARIWKAGVKEDPNSLSWAFYLLLVFLNLVGSCCRQESTTINLEEIGDTFLEPSEIDHGLGTQILATTSSELQHSSSCMEFYSNRTKKIIAQDIFQIH